MVLPGAASRPGEEGGGSIVGGAGRGGASASATLALLGADPEQT
jgi:hypothetical protein